MTAASQPLTVETTPIPGLLVVRLPVHADHRGWFKENWQRQKMVAAGLPDFGPVQNNVSFNAAVGVTRGVHAEPWDKYVAVAAGRVFGAWVDLRAGASFGATFWLELDPAVAVFVPRGVGNAFQSLEAGTAYTYLVNDHWSAGAEYTAVNLADETVAIPWPIPLAEGELSAQDLAHPALSAVQPMQPKRTLVLGGSGQLGRALRARWTGRDDVDVLDRAAFDLADPAAFDAIQWRQYGTVINAAASTAVDAAETPAGRETAWLVNAHAPARLAALAREHGFVLVHISSDYVFDGARTPHGETEPFSPLSVYGQSKAAGDLAVAAAPRHYLVRTSWVVGDGANFVRTMASLAERGIDPAVVDDQVGRLTFADELARAIEHLLVSQAPWGAYNVTNSGEPTSWADLARIVFTAVGHDPGRVQAVSTATYTAGKPGIAPRPPDSTLDLAKLTATGFTAESQDAALRRFLAEPSADSAGPDAGRHAG